MTIENEKVNRIYKYDEWLPWEQNASPMLLVLALNAGMQNLKDYFDRPLWTSIIIFEDDQAQWLFRPKELKMLGQKMIDFLMCPPYRVAFMTGYEEEEKRLLKKTQEIQFKTDLTKLTNHSLIELFDGYSQIYYNWYKYGWFCEPIQFQSQDLLIAFLEKEREKKSLDMDIDNIKQAIFAVEEKTFTVEILEHTLQCAQALDSVLKNAEIANKIQATAQGVEFVQSVTQIIFDASLDERKTNEALKFLIEKVTEHSKMFYWKQNNYFSTQLLTEKDILIELFASDTFNISDPVSPIEGELQEIADNKEEILKIKHRLLEIFPPYERNIAVLASLVGGLIDRRKKTIMIANAAFDRIINEVSDRTNTDLDSCRLLIPQELQYFLEAPEEYDERFVERQNLFVLYQGEFSMLDELFSDITQKNVISDLNFENFAMTEPFIAEGDHANKLLDQLNSRLNFMVSSEVTTLDKVQGMSIYYEDSQPILEGIVKIIRNPKSENIEKDEILVAPSTTPDYMAAIRLCKAIVVDWGGQTSHAAITSRELRKPCIIGTNYASQIFQTGDKIQIDFKNGTVEKVE